MPTRTPEQFQRDMEAEIADAKRDMVESSGASMNSYGAGYDTGYLDGLKRARSLWEGSDE